MGEVKRHLSRHASCFRKKNNQTSACVSASQDRSHSRNSPAVSDATGAKAEASCSSRISRVSFHKKIGTGAFYLARTGRRRSIAVTGAARLYARRHRLCASFPDRPAPQQSPPWPPQHCPAAWGSPTPWRQPLPRPAGLVPEGSVLFIVCSFCVAGIWLPSVFIGDELKIATSDLHRRAFGECRRDRLPRPRQNAREGGA